MKKQQIVTYPAIITPDENQTYDIEFVDVPEVLGLALYHQKVPPKTITSCDTN